MTNRYGWGALAAALAGQSAPGQVPARPPAFVPPQATIPYQQQLMQQQMQQQSQTNLQGIRQEHQAAQQTLSDSARRNQEALDRQTPASVPQHYDFSPPGAPLRGTLPPGTTDHPAGANGTGSAAPSGANPSGAGPR